MKISHLAVAAALLSGAAPVVVMAQTQSPPPSAAVAPADMALNGLIADYETYLKATDPFTAASEGDVAAMARTPDLSRSFELAQRAPLEAFVSRLNAIDPASLSHAGTINRDFLLYTLNRSLEGLDYDTGRLAFDSEGGPGTWAIYIGGSTRLNSIAEAEAYRKGADEMARGMSASPFFDGIHPAAVLNELRRDAPESSGQFLNSLVLMAGVKYLPQGLVSEDERFAALRDIGRGFVAAARAVEQERNQRGVYDTAQWNDLSADLLRIAGQGVSMADARAVNDGMLIETGRRFYPDALALVTGGLFSVIGAAARAPIRITPDILDDAGRFLGQRSGGPNAPSFRNWSAKPGNDVEIMPGGQVRYTTTITDPASSLNGRTVSVSYTDGAPDFSQLGVARVDIPNPVGRGVGADTADMRAASRALWAEIRAGRIDARRFTEVQLDDIRSGRAQITGLTWHHDGISLNQDGTGPMLLLDRRAHIIFGHVGWASTINP